MPMLLIAATAYTAVCSGDPHSYAETDRFLVRHVALALNADFAAHRLEGTAELTVEQIDPTDWRAYRISAGELPVQDWVPHEWVRFLDEQPANLEDARLAELRSAFRFGADGNAEIARSWLALVIRTAHEPAYADLERFLLSTGRYKLVVTLFQELARTPSGTELGRRIYATAKPGYHATIRQAVERLLYPDESTR